MKNTYVNQYDELRIDLKVNILFTKTPQEYFKNIFSPEHRLTMQRDRLAFWLFYFLDEHWHLFTAYLLSLYTVQECSHAFFPAGLPIFVALSCGFRRQMMFYCTRAKYPLHETPFRAAPGLAVKSRQQTCQKVATNFATSWIFLNRRNFYPSSQICLITALLKGDVDSNHILGNVWVFQG